MPQRRGAADKGRNGRLLFAQRAGRRTVKRCLMRPSPERDDERLHPPRAPRFQPSDTRMKPNVYD